MGPLSDWPNADEEQQLLGTLVTGSPTARNAFVVRFFPLLCAALARRWPRAAPDLIEEAAGDALLGFLRRPERYDPGRATLGAYLRMSARGDLRNLLHKERRAARGVALDSVAEPAARGYEGDGDGPTWDDPRLAAELAALDPCERAALDLMRAGTRDTDACARELDLMHLTAGARAAAVKRIKDRVKRRLVRALEDSQ